MYRKIYHFVGSGAKTSTEGKNAEVNIVKVTSVESPVVRDLKKRVAELETELAQSKAVHMHFILFVTIEVLEDTVIMENDIVSIITVVAMK